VKVPISCQDCTAPVTRFLSSTRRGGIVDDAPRAPGPEPVEGLCPAGAAGCVGNAPVAGTWPGGGVPPGVGWVVGVVTGGVTGGAGGGGGTPGCGVTEGDVGFWGVEGEGVPGVSSEGMGVGAPGLEPEP
jgi:hypothetical protein